MACRLILNADDFGLTRGINRAIAELHQAGAITSATLMATGAAFEDAVTLAASVPGLGVGCHVVLMDGRPASSPNEIPSLLGGDGRYFRPTLGRFLRDLWLGRIRAIEIQREAEAQIRRLQLSGIRVTHVDTHKHTHIFPQVARAILLAARRCGVLAIRNPFEPSWATALSREDASRMRLGQISLLRRLEPSFRQLASSQSTTTTGTLGIAATGILDSTALRTLLHAAHRREKEDTLYEIVCHPGHWDDDLRRTNTRLQKQREIELRALLEVVPAYRHAPNACQLMHYGDLQL